jgi:hypothetical protein
MVGIQQATILNDLHEIQDLPGEGNRTVFVGIDRQVDGLVLFKGGGTEAANHARTRTVQRVVGDSRGVTVREEGITKPSILRGTVARGPAITKLVRESHQETCVGRGDRVVIGRAAESIVSKEGGHCEASDIWDQIFWGGSRTESWLGT